MKMEPGKHRCSALNTEGKQCKRKPEIKTYYHGDGEIYSFHGPEPMWVAVYLCVLHRQPKAKR